ncbi:MAG: HD domain-containing phosphohydrolase [Elusimicrobiota bacterium]
MIPLLTTAVILLAAAVVYLLLDSRRQRDQLVCLDQRRQDAERERDKIQNALNSSVDPAVAKLIVEENIHNEKRSLSVLFSDLVGFTPSLEKSQPETIISELNQLFTVMTPVITRFKGHIDKFIGDGLMAEFGVPHTAHHHPLLAVLAALSMQRRLKTYRFPWKMRLGVASGVSFVGLMGSRLRKNYTAIGDTVNLAARLQALCPVGSVCVDEAIFNATRRWLDIRRLRSGLKPEAVRKIELQLKKLERVIEEDPTAKDCLEAASLAVSLGDMQAALRYHKMALELDPKQRRPVERAISTLLSGEERAFLDIKGKKDRVAVYEVLGLKDFLMPERVSRRVRHTYQWLAADIPLLEEWVLSIEAIEGRLGHAQVTAAISGAVADGMGLGPEQVKEAFLAGYYDDVGKLNVSEHLLCYEGRLSDLPQTDQDAIHSHVTESEKVLAGMQIPVTPGILRAIRQHHERFDGNGYPEGLKGGDIDLVGRIVRVADTYEALTSWRSYQEALTRESALVEICRDISDGAIDPDVGKVFLEVMAR